jgi:pimeloyl-ACP methyl ester carboxylesterase
MHFMYGTFTMEVHPDIGDMTGVAAKWNPPVDLHLKYMPRVATYREEPIMVRNHTVSIVGTLYLPIRPEPAPLAIIIPGSSDQGRASFEYRGYGPMLAQQGIAVLVYDKRNVGASSHVPQKATFSDYASDANALVDALRYRRGIDPHRIGLGGASQGGWIASMAAANDPNVSFLLLLCGPAVSVEQQELDRVEAAMLARGASSGDTASARRITQMYFDVADGRAPLSDLQSQVNWLAREKPNWADVLSGPDPGESLQDAVDDWKRIQFDPAATLRHTRIPVLALFASKDDEVLSSDNAPLMKTLLGSNNPRNRIVVLEGATHALFMGQGLNGNTWQWPDQYWSWDRRAPDLIPTIVSWVRALH